MMAARAVVKSFQVVLIAFIIANILEIVQAEVCPYFVTDGRTIVTSPNYPNLYPNNYDCSWSFETIPLRRIELIFNFLHLEDCSNCGCDYVALYDGNTKDAPKLGQFCGTLSNFSVTSTSQKLLMIFHSDHNLQQFGFKVTYKTEFNLEKGISNEQERKSTQYFLNRRQQHTHATNKWGSNIARTAVALFLDDPRFFGTNNKTGEEIAYELTLQLMSKLITKKQISTNDLALFIHAMTVACIDPKKFYGVNIGAEFRRRVDKNDHTNPFYILVLCNGGEDLKIEDVQNLRQLFVAQNWTDTRAMVIMALQCISKQKPHLVSDDIITHMVSELKEKQQNNGTIVNLKTTALVLQALIANDNEGNDLNIERALRAILYYMDYYGVKDIEEMYYFLPIIRWKTLLDINSNHCASIIKTDLDTMEKVRDPVDEIIQVQTSVVIGNDMDFSRVWQIKVPSNFSFYQVLQTIKYSEPNFELHYTVLGSKPYVSSLVGFHNSVEDGLFWFIYTKPLSSTDDPVLIEQSPVNIQVNETDELILWYRSGLRPNVQEIWTDPHFTESTTILYGITEIGTHRNWFD